VKRNEYTKKKGQTKEGENKDIHKSKGRIRIYTRRKKEGGGGG
jgi:hypothetical protein